MTNPSHSSPAPAPNQNRRKKVRAVMASGLVLGVGAAVTLAAWSDSVWGAGTFGTENTSFNVQGSFDGGTSWDEHVTADEAGSMSFTQNADHLIPGEPVYQLVGLQEVEGNMGADVTLTRTNADTSALADLVSVAVADLGTGTTAPACDASADFGTPATIGTPAGTMLTTDIAAAGHRWVCFSATLAPDTPATVGDVTSEPIAWEFAAMSRDDA